MLSILTLLMIASGLQSAARAMFADVRKTDATHMNTRAVVRIAVPQARPRPEVGHKMRCKIKRD